MTLISRLSFCLAVLACCVATPFAQGKGGSKPPSKYYGEAVFRCPNTAPPFECALTDGLYGNQEQNDLGYPFIGTGTNWLGAGLLSANSEMHLGLDSGGVAFYRAWIDLRDQAADGPCLATNNCRFPLNRGPFEVTGGEIQSNVVDANGNEINGGLFSIQVGNTAAQTRFRIGFRHPENPAIAWTLIFSVAQYSGATNASVKRTAACTWVFETNATDHLAGLWSVGQIGGKGKSVRIDEGLFRVPTKVTFRAYDAPGCPPRP
jgi:hypothetical protein